MNQIGSCRILFIHTTYILYTRSSNAFKSVEWINVTSMKNVTFTNFSFLWILVSDVLPTNDLTWRLQLWLSVARFTCFILICFHLTSGSFQFDVTFVVAFRLNIEWVIFVLLFFSLFYFTPSKHWWCGELILQLKHFLLPHLFLSSFLPFAFFFFCVPEHNHCERELLHLRLPLCIYSCYLVVFGMFCCCCCCCSSVYWFPIFHLKEFLVWIFPPFLPISFVKVYTLRFIMMMT